MKTIKSKQFYPALVGPNIVLSAIWLITALSAPAQLLFSEDFDADHTGNWTVNKSSSQDFADFFFNYSAVGIPSAPHSIGGSTRGLKLEANTAGDIFSGLSVSPTGQSFSGNYFLRFDMWLNYNGPLDTGGDDSTQVTGGGIGTAGTSAQWAGSIQDSVHFGATGDGGSSHDYRAYSSAAPAGYPDGSAVFSASGTGNRNSSHPYYAGFGGETAPAGQVTLHPQQTGSTPTGSPGFAWRDVMITKEGTNVTFEIDGLRIATVPLTAEITLGGGNILLTHYDANAASSSDPNARNLLFGLIDNVTVSVVPEPPPLALALMGAAGLFFLLNRRR